MFSAIDKEAIPKGKRLGVMGAFLHGLLPPVGDERVMCFDMASMNSGQRTQGRVDTAPRAPILN